MKLTAFLLAASAHAADWTNVRIGGGGGFVPGISFHPTEAGLAYARTDIGGLYRLNGDDSWTPITDSLADSENWNTWGVDAMALDPQDPEKIYAAVGMYTNSWDPNNGRIIRSSDRGETWDATELPFKVGGNMPGRGMGERLAVDPQNSSVLLFGARSGKGLYRSDDGGVTFSAVESFTGVGTYIPNPSDVGGYNGDIQGLAFVTFDSTSDLVGGASGRIFVGTADNETASVYVSEDAGATWAPLEGQPDRYFPHKCKLEPTEKALYITYADGTGPYDGTSGAVWRYDIAGAKWTDITPDIGEDLFYGFGGLALDAKNPGTLMVASLNSWWPDAQIFRSTDSGATWTTAWEWVAYPDMKLRYSTTTPRAPWVNENFVSVDSKKLGWMIEALEIDPLDSDHWLYGTGLTVFGGRDLTGWEAGKVNIESLADGIEEFAVLALASVPGGSELLAAVGDDSGFTFATKGDLDTSPKTAWSNPMFTSSTGVDFAGNSPAKVVRVGNMAGSPQVATSSDGGATWAAVSSAGNVHFGGRVAYSADADTIVWSSGSSGVLRSAAGAAFEAVSAVPSGAPVASDKKENGYFYAGSEALLVSSDGGATWAEGGALAGASKIQDIVAHPVVAGEIYVSTDVGVFRSTDFGATLEALGAGVTNTHRISLGVGSGDSWLLYAFGTGAAGPRLYTTGDLGASWTDVQGDSQGFGAIDANPLVGSANEPGVVYVGTNGRGVFYAQVAVEGLPSNSTEA
ncbi:probable Xyloglucanase [Cephalotrichum gorgonifer]|uniref:Probable Xyloglucanase n=1 Tax=Cephalotrichum gorgonifer TaxID=2041049 RepID=A0AAE8N3F6_9PEZI|nr:probable Xyloglucanase [Cephalotrichum gorgonifer]